MGKFHILSLSGGGYKGLFSARVLEILEDQISSPIARKFDLVAGTSIGGIVALGIALEIPASEIVRAFRTGSNLIFPPKRIPFQDQLSGLLRPKYTSDGLRKVLTQLFGEKTIGDLRHRVIIPTVNYLKGGPHVVKTRHHEKLRLDFGLKLVDVALATSAAPIYFPMHRLGSGEYLDGGLVANHPGLFALMEAQQYLGQKSEDLVQLHVGTLSQTFASSGKSGARHLGLLQWNKRLIEMIFSCQEKSTENLLRILMNERYKSIDHQITAEQSKIVGLDKTSNDAKRVLMELAKISTQEYLGSNHFQTVKNHYASEFMPIPL